MVVFLGGPLQKNFTCSLGSSTATRREMGPDTFFFSEPFRASASQTTPRIAELNRSFRGDGVGSSFPPSLRSVAHTSQPINNFKTHLVLFSPRPRTRAFECSISLANPCRYGNQI